MIWVFAIALVLVLGGIAFVAAGFGAPMADEHGDRPDAGIPPTGRLSGSDLRRVRFPLALRGYRMSDVDALLHRLATEREDEEQRAEEDRERFGPAPEADLTEDPPTTPREPEPPR